MKKLFILLLTWNCLIFSTVAQSVYKRKLDSLNLLLSKTDNDSIRLRLYIELSNVCDIEDNIKYAKPAIQIADKLLQKTTDVELRVKILKQKVDALGLLGVYYRTIDNIPQALENYQLGLKISKEINYQKGIALLLVKMGRLYRDQGNTSQALDNYLKSLTIFSELKDTSGISSCYLVIGGLYGQIHQVEKAIEYMQKSIALGKTKMGYVQVYNYIGGIYESNNDITNALLYYQKSLSLCDSSMDKYWLVESLNNVGNVYSKQGLFDKALEYNFKALKFSDEKKFVSQKAKS